MDPAKYGGGEVRLHADPDMLKAMLRWAQNYDTGEDGTKSRIAAFQDKTVILRGNRDIRRYIKSMQSIK